MHSKLFSVTGKEVRSWLLERITVPNETNSSQCPIKNTHHKNGLVKWLKVYTLNSNPSTAKNKNKKRKLENEMALHFVI
jgi:hypothetical protein